MSDFLKQLAIEQKRSGLSRRLEANVISPPDSLSFAELMQLVKEKNLTPFDVKTIDLSTAKTIPTQMFGAGTFLYALDATDEASNIQVKFSNANADNVQFTKNYGLEVPHSAIYMTWEAQAGKSITVMQAVVAQVTRIHDHRKISTISAIDEVTSIPNLNILDDDASEVHASATSKDTAGTATLHTVTTGKVLKVSSSYCGYRGGGDAGFSRIFVTDDSDVFQYDIIRAYSQASGQPQNNSINHLPYIEVPAGYKVKLNKRLVTSDADQTGGDAVGGFHGFEVTA